MLNKQYKNNLILQKSYAFAVRIVKLYKFLINDGKNLILPKQLLRCGTSIGANIEEAIGGQSKKDFLSKISIAYKEARETHYWLRILKDTEFLTEKAFSSIIVDLEELLKIITKIQKTLKSNIEL